MGISGIFFWYILVFFPKKCRDFLHSSLPLDNKQDCCGERLSNYVIRAGMLRGNQNEIVGTIKGPGTHGYEYEITFKKMVMVEWLWIGKVDKDTMHINGLTLIEGKWSHYFVCKSVQKVIP